MMLILGLGALAFIALAMAKGVTRWFVDRQIDPLFAPLPEEDTKTDPDAPKAPPHQWTIQEQVDNKVDLQTPEFEIRVWLGAKHGVVGDEAAAYIEKARKRQRGSVRGKSALAMLACLAVMAATALPVAKHFRDGEIVLAKDALLLMGMSFSTILFGRYLIRTITGKSDEPVQS